MFYSITNFVVLCGENMLSKKLKIVCSVKVSRLEFVSLPIVDQLHPNICKLPCVEQDYKTRLKNYYVKCC